MLPWWVWAIAGVTAGGGVVAAALGVFFIREILDEINAEAATLDEEVDEELLAGLEVEQG